MHYHFCLETINSQLLSMDTQVGSILTMEFGIMMDTKVGN